MKIGEDEVSETSCFKKFYTCSNFKSFMSNAQIHPLDILPSSENQYLTVDRDKKIRVIHVSPKNILRERSKLDKRVSRASLSDEYWFTQWGKPLRNNPCKCSFRRSARFSKLSTELGIFASQRIDSNKKTATSSKAISNLDTFVELFIQETLLSAYQEISNRNSANEKISSSKKEGLVNLGFVPIENDIIQEEDIFINEKKLVGNVELRKKNCVHSQNGIKTVSSSLLKSI